MFKIPILRQGTFTDKYGQEVTIDKDVISQIVGTHDPTNFRAPLILSHDLPPGETDVSISEHSELAFGTPDRLEEKDGHVWAVFSKLAPKFREFWRNGQILGFSSSLYPPGNEANPYGDRWSLRHIAALGKNPPAIKGLGDPIGLSEHGLPVSEGEQPIVVLSNYDLSIGVSTPETPAIEFAFPLEGFMRNLRERTIEKEGMESADALVPQFLVDEAANFFESYQRQLSTLWDELYDLRMRVPPEPVSLAEPEDTMPDKTKTQQNPQNPANPADPAPATPTIIEGVPTASTPQVVPAPAEVPISAAEFAELKRAHEQLQEQNAQLAETVNRDRARTYCLSLGIPYLMQTVDLSETGGDITSMDLIDFMSTLTSVQQVFLKGLLERIPKPVDVDTEVVTPHDEPPQFSETVTDDRAKDLAVGELIKEIRRKARANGRQITLSEARTQALAEIKTPPVI